jgi:hypothetical protein
MRRISPVMLIVFLVLFLAPGLAMLGFAGRAWWKSNQVASWPATEGTLIERTLEDSSDSDGTTYRVKVRYVYTVVGREYQADRIAYGYTGSSGRESHKAIYDKLMRGDRVRVRYDPANPAEAALAHGLNQSTIMLLLFGAMWTSFIIGAVLLIWIDSSGDMVLIDRLIVR